MVAPALMYGAAGLMGLNTLMGNANQAKNDAATRRAQKELLMRMEQAAQFYEQYRPQMANARARGTNAQFAAYQGANDALTTLYGAESAPAAQMDSLMMIPQQVPRGPSTGQNMLSVHGAIPSQEELDRAHELARAAAAERSGAEAGRLQEGSMDAVARATGAANSGRAAGAAQGPPGSQMALVRAAVERRNASPVTQAAGRRPRMY